MQPRSIFDYDVSVSADKRRRTRRRGMSGAFESSRRGCDHPGCDRAASYRAPVSPERLDDYYWFCLDHVREYNRAWNYFEGSSEEELEAQMRADMVWDRPTWRLGEAPRRAPDMHGHAEGQAWRRFGFEDPFEVLGDNATINPGERPDAGAAPPRRRLPPNEQRALDVLGADETRSRSEIRAIFKRLVKDLHPDMNGGSREDEARLREVLWAWDLIKVSRSFRD